MRPAAGAHPAKVSHDAAYYESRSDGQERPPPPPRLRVQHRRGQPPSRRASRASPGRSARSGARRSASHRRRSSRGASRPSARASVGAGDGRAHVRRAELGQGHPSRYCTRLCTMTAGGPGCRSDPRARRTGRSLDQSSPFFITSRSRRILAPMFHTGWRGVRRRPAAICSSVEWRNGPAEASGSAGRACRAALAGTPGRWPSARSPPAPARLRAWGLGPRPRRRPGSPCWPGHYRPDRAAPGWPEAATPTMAAITQSAPPSARRPHPPPPSARTPDRPAARAARQAGLVGDHRGLGARHACSPAGRRCAAVRAVA